MSAHHLSETYYASNLGNGVTVRLVNINHTFVVDIRQWGSFNTTCKKYPSEKGIALSTQNWARLYQESDTIKNILSDSHRTETEEIDIGGSVYITRVLTSSSVDNRQWHMKNNDLIPTKKGISLHCDQFNSFLNKFEEIHQCLPDSAREIPCYLSDDHNNQLGVLLCQDINLFNCHNYTLCHVFNIF